MAIGPQAWTNLLPQPQQQRVNTLADSYDPVRTMVGAAQVANMMDERKTRGIQNRILLRKNELEEKAGDLENELLPLVGKEITGQPMLPTSVGLVAKSAYDQAAINNPTGARQESKIIYANMMSMAAERRKAAEAYREKLVGAGWRTGAIDQEVLRQFPDAAASVQQGGPMPRTANMMTAPQAGTPAAPAPITPATPNEVGDVQQRVNFMQGGGHLPQAAPVNTMAAVTPEERGALQQGAPLPPPAPVAPQTPQPATAPGQPTDERGAFLDAITKAQTATDPEEGLKMLGAMKPENNWERDELKAARMFLATRAGAPKRVPGSNAEFEDTYEKEHGKGSIAKILGTPEYGKEWTKWKKANLTPAAVVKLEYAAPTAEAGATGRLRAEFNALKSVGIKVDEQTGEVDQSTIPREIKNTAQMIASYQMPLPSGFALRSPYWQAVLGVVKTINPQFNALEYEARKKAIDANNSPTFMRMRNNADLLVNAQVDPKTGKQMGEGGELDKIVKARNMVNPGVFGSISPKLRAFNSWDQFIAYEVSDSNMAKFKGTLIANIERLGSVYAGGGNVTSDYKMKLAQEFLDPALGKQAFKDLVESHKDSIAKTLARFSNAYVGGIQGVPLETPGGGGGAVPPGGAKQNETYKSGW